MTAYVSGQAGRAVVLRGGQFLGIELDSSSEVPLHRTQLASYLAHSVDVEGVSTSVMAEVRSRLEMEWSIDRALVLTLIAFDSRHSEPSRSRATHEAEVLLESPECRDTVVNLLSSAELPDSFDSDSAIAFIGSRSSGALLDILQDLVSRRSYIAECVRSWNDVVPSLAHSSQDVARARYRLAKIGVFRSFVTAASAKNDAILKILVDPVLSANKALARDVVSVWASKYKSRPLPTELRTYGDLGVSAANGFESFSGQRRPESAYDAFSRVNRKIRSIKQEYTQAKYKRADSLVEYLVGDQLSSSDPEFVAKSLCNVAIFCRGLGDVGRYFAFTKRAVDLVPQDAWAHVQLGNAYLAAGHYRDALSSFEKAEVAGDERSALLGRAEVLKAVGQQDVALSTLDRCMEAYPNDEVARNSRAALLAYFGELERALTEYNELVASPHVSSHSYGGRALVLDDMGQTQKALIDIDSAIALAPDDAIPLCAKGDILRRSREYDAALRVLDVRKTSAEARLMLGLTAVRVLRDKGDLRAAEKRALGLMEVYPNDLASKVAIADLLRRSGRFEDALLKYRSLENEIGFTRMARYGIASTFASLGRYEEAVSYLSTHATTAGDWVSKLLFGMIQVRIGEYRAAEIILMDGQAECPWIRIRSQFSSALVHLHLRQKKVDEAVEIFEQKVSTADVQDEGSLLLAYHIQTTQRKTTSVDTAKFVSKLFQQAAGMVRQFSHFEIDESEELFDAEWLALTSLAA